MLAVLLATALPASATTSRILPDQDAWPVWSPDGTHIAFTRISGRIPWSSRSVDLRTHRSVTKIAHERGQLRPSWSPTGRTARLLRRAARLYVVRIAGGARQSATSRAGLRLRSRRRWQPGDRASLRTSATRLGETSDLVGRPGSLRAARRDRTPRLGASDGKRSRFSAAIPATSRSPSPERCARAPSEPGSAVFARDGSLTAARGDRDDGHAADAVSRRVGRHRHAERRRSAIRLARRRDVDAAGGRSTSSTRGLGPRCVTARAHVAYAGPARRVPRATSDPGSRAPRADGHLRGARHAGRRRDRGHAARGDVILGLAGNDQIHANDGHTDTVNCGPGRDTVWADRTDKLTGCEIIHR